MTLINLIFSGDFAPLLSPDQIADSHFSDLSRLFESCDLHITNLECPLTLGENEITKTGPHLKAHPDTIVLLKQARVDVVCLANNHIFDYDEQGILDTINVCQQNEIETLGIVSRPDGEAHWLIKEVKGKKIGFLNYCEHEFSVREKNRLGASGYDLIEAYYDIEKIRPLVDWLIVIYHGGNEYYPLPQPSLKKAFHFLADIGADAVIGHHTHVYSGYEIYNNKPLVYSLGNFFFPYPNEPISWHEGVMCKCSLTDKINIELIPIIQCKDGFEIFLFSDKQKENILNEIEIFKKIIYDDKKLAESWTNFVKSSGKKLAHRLLFPTYIDKIIIRIPFMKYFLKEAIRRRSLTNILRCSSLRQLLIDSLKI